MESAKFSLASAEESESLLLKEFSHSNEHRHLHHDHNNQQYSKPVISCKSANCDKYNQHKICDCQLNHHNFFEDITSCLKEDGDDEHYQLLSPENDGTFSEEQSTGAVFWQMLLPFTVAGLGSTFAGIILERITTTADDSSFQSTNFVTTSSTNSSNSTNHANFSTILTTSTNHQSHPTSVFSAIPQLEIMVPAFIGLIGNIQTTLASRLSTAANLGALDKGGGANQRLEIVTGNAAVVLCQAAFTGLFAALASVAISTCRASTREEISPDGVLLLCASAVLTSTVAASLMATLIFTIVFGARRYGVNPDNISTPVAASLGDVCSLSILAFTSRLLYRLYRREHALKLIALILTILALAAISGGVARRCRHTSTVILTGWAAILGAVLVEQPGGMVMEGAIQRHRLLAAFQPLVNGIGSNLVGIQTSRLSTFLHSKGSKNWETKESGCDKSLLVNEGSASSTKLVSSPCVSPMTVYFSKDINSKVARLLLAVLLPAHLFFMTIIYFLLKNGHVFPASFAVPPLVPTPAFLLVYCSAVSAQLLFLLYVAHVAVQWAWETLGVNPDNAAIPFTSALADLLGNIFMALAFSFLSAIGDPNGAAAN